MAFYFTTGGELVNLDGFAVDSGSSANSSSSGRISYNLVTNFNSLCNFPKALSYSVPQI